MLHTFEDWFCSAKLLDFPFFCYCTFLYRLISVVSYFYLYFSYLRKRKTLLHERVYQSRMEGKRTEASDKLFAIPATCA